VELQRFHDDAILNFIVYNKLALHSAPRLVPLGSRAHAYSARCSGGRMNIHVYGRELQQQAHRRRPLGLGLQLLLGSD